MYTCSFFSFLRNAVPKAKIWIKLKELADYMCLHHLKSKMKN